MTREQRLKLLDRAYVLAVRFKSGGPEFELIAAAVGVESAVLRDVCLRAQSSLGIGPIPWDYYLPPTTGDETT